MSAPDPAKARLWLLTGVRLGGALLVLASFALAARDQPLAALPLALLGVGALVALPRHLLKRWRQDR